MTGKRIDVAAARQAFEAALESHEQVFGRFFLARLLGFEVRHEPDLCIVEFEVRDFMFNPQGTLHGGIVALAMDVSMGHLLERAAGPGATLEMKLQYLRAMGTGRARAEGRLLRRGGRICFLESRLLDASGELAAFATSTWTMPRRESAAGSGPAGADLAR